MIIAGKTLLWHQRPPVRLYTPTGGGAEDKLQGSIRGSLIKRSMATLNLGADL